jgi:hypothetical protein
MGPHLDNRRELMAGPGLTRGNDTYGNSHPARPALTLEHRHFGQSYPGPDTNATTITLS